MQKKSYWQVRCSTYFGQRMRLISMDDLALPPHHWIHLGFLFLPE
jgi:hypothetical protein